MSAYYKKKMDETQKYMYTHLKAKVAIVHCSMQTCPKGKLS